LICDWSQGRLHTGGLPFLPPSG